MEAFLNHGWVSSGWGSSGWDSSGWGSSEWGSSGWVLDLIAEPIHTMGAGQRLFQQVHCGILATLLLQSSPNKQRFLDGTAWKPCSLEIRDCGSGGQRRGMGVVVEVV